MTSKERFLTALNRQKPDRPPVTTHHVMSSFRFFISIVVSLWMTTSLFSQSMPVFWQIGQKDGSAAEFALDWHTYRQFPQKFGDKPIVYEIGKTNPKTDFPFTLPGPSDNWYGNNPRQIVIRFGIGDITSPCSARLELNYLDTRHTPPLLEITVNGYKVQMQTPVGKDLYLTVGRVNPDNLSTIVDIPENVLKKGNNTIVIQTIRGNWLVFDNLSLSTAYPLQLVASKEEINILSVDAVQGLIYGKNRELRQPVSFLAANWENVQTVDVLIDGKFSEKVLLQNGLTTIETSIPEVKKETDVTIAFSVESKIIAQTTLKANPVKNRTIYLVQHTHTDIGYTKPQTEILAEHIRYIDYAIEYCELTDNYPDDAKFRWTCEASWAVKEWMNNRPKAQIDKFVKYVKEGRIEVTGMFFNMAEIVDENSFKTFLEPIREFKKLGIPVKTAMQNDVNGIAWCLADYMPDIGIKYFTMGSNSHRALIPFDRPTVYKWESPSGKQAYSFRSDHYMTGNSWGLGGELSVEKMAPHVFFYLESLEKRDYPFDAISVQYQGYRTDNSPPSMIPNDVIRDWNSKYATPKLRSAVIHEFLDYIASKYDAQLPVYRVAYPDWWTDGFGSAARETAASRRTHSDMIAIQGLLSMAALKDKTLPTHVPDKIRHVHENLLFYDEHTYGAAESIRDPMCENSMIQWAEKASYAWEALKTAQIMYETSIGLLQGDINRGEYPTVTFYNTLNWARSGVVELYIDHEIIPRNRNYKIIDESGKELKSQLLRSRSEGSYYAIYAEDLPPMGYKTYRIITENENMPALPRTSLNDNTVENEYFKIVFDTQAGSIKSLFDKKLQLEMVDSDADRQLGDFVYENLLEGLVNSRIQMEFYTLTQYKRTGLTNVRIQAGTNGPVYQTVSIEGKSACCDDGFGVKIEIRLFHHEKRIELHYAIRNNPIIDPVGVYVAFPFKLAHSRLFFDVQGGVVSPGVNQLEGSSSEWNTVQNFVAARNDKAQFVVGSDQIPLFQLGGMISEKFQRVKTYEFPHVYSWVTNNYWVTNFRASQEGELRWSYYLTSDSDISNTFATRFGWSARVPIYGRVMPKGAPNNMPTSFSSFRFSNDNLLMTSATPSIEEGYILINVRELDGKPTPFQISDATGKVLEFSIVNAIEETMQSGLKEVQFAPFENKFIKLKSINK